MIVLENIAVLIPLYSIHGLGHVFYLALQIKLIILFLRIFFIVRCHTEGYGSNVIIGNF